MYADNLHLFWAISTQSDYCVLRNDVAAIENYSSSNSLNFNISICKYMVISQKRTPTTPASPILLNGIPLERVELFKHLGLIISSWSNHITSICAEAKRILGLLYRQYYNHVEGDVLKQLYISLVRPHLEYDCAVWDLYTLKDKRNLEQVQM